MPKFHCSAYGVFRLNSVVNNVGVWLRARLSSIVRGTLNVGVAIGTIPPPLTVLVRSCVIVDANPALPPTEELLSTVALLSIAYAIEKPPRIEVLPVLNGSHAKLKFGAQLFRSLARNSRPVPLPAKSRTALGLFNAASDVSTGISPRPSRSVRGLMYSQRIPTFNDKFSFMR